VRRQDKRKLEPDTAACSLSCHKRQIPPLASHLIRNLLLLISLQIARLEFLVANESIRAEFWIILACYIIGLLSHCACVIFNHIGRTTVFQRHGLFLWLWTEFCQLKLLLFKVEG